MRSWRRYRGRMWFMIIIPIMIRLRMFRVMKNKLRHMSLKKRMMTIMMTMMIMTRKMDNIIRLRPACFWDINRTTSPTSSTSIILMGHSHLDFHRYLRAIERMTCSEKVQERFNWILGIQTTWEIVMIICPSRGWTQMDRYPTTL